MDAARDFRYWLTWAAAVRRKTVDEAPAATIAAELRVSARTVRRWERLNRAPPWAVQVLMMLADGVPIGAGDEWVQWRFVRHRGRVQLCGPDGSTWSPGDLLAYGTTWRRGLELELRQAAPGSQLTWMPASASTRREWPGAVPTWSQLEEALRHVLEDQVRQSLR